MAKDITKTGSDGPDDKPNGTPPAAPQAAAPALPSDAVTVVGATGSSPSDAAEDDGKALYTVTPRAGPRVAGRRVKPNQDIRLTREEARADLLTGAIVRKGQKLHEQLKADAKPRDPITKKQIDSGKAA